MTHVSYELRTLRNARVFSFDDIVRAKAEKLKAEKRVGVKMQLVKITLLEEPVDA
jgi:hypothetical protein